MNTYFLSKEESDRLKIIKYIAIVLVVYLHAYATEVNFAEGTNNFFIPEWLMLFENLVSQVIARCGVPIFFLISSILLFKTQRNYGKTIKNKVKTLLVPYMIWNTFWIVVFIILQSFSFTAPYFSGNNTLILQSSVAQWFELYGIGSSWPYPQNYPLWFMRDLMVVVLFFPVIWSVANIFPKQLLTAAIVLLLMPFTFPFKAAVLWFCIGACMVKLQIHITVFDSVLMWKISLIYIVCMVVTLMTENAVFDSLFVFIGIIYWIRVSKCIYDSERVRMVFLILSEWTFMIYVSHELTLSSLKKLCFRLLPTEPVWLLAEYLMLPIVVIVGCSIAGVILKRIAPKLYYISTGLR